MNHTGHTEAELQVFREMVKAYKKESSDGDITDAELFTRLSKVLETASKEALNIAPMTISPRGGGGGAGQCSFLDHSTSSLSTSTLSFTCPTRRFGRTELQMPIISCGGVSKNIKIMKWVLVKQLRLDRSFPSFLSSFSLDENATDMEAA